LTTGRFKLLLADRWLVDCYNAAGTRMVDTAARSALKGLGKLRSRRQSQYCAECQNTL